VIPRLRRPQVVHIRSADSAEAADAAWVNVTGLSWEEGMSIPAQIERLRAMVDQVLQEVGRVREQTRAQIAQVSGRLGVVESDLRTAVDDLRRRMEVAERRAAQANARGILLLGAGLVLTGIPQELAEFEVIGWTSVALAVVGTFWVLSAVLRDREVAG
jgi:hypothetical protein